MPDERRVKNHKLFDPPQLLPFGMSSDFLLLIDDLQVLSDDMLSDLGNQVNELNVFAEIMKGFNPMIVFKIVIHSSLSMIRLSGYQGWVFFLYDDFSDDHSLVGDGRTHVM